MPTYLRSTMQRYALSDVVCLMAVDDGSGGGGGGVGRMLMSRRENGKMH